MLINVQLLGGSVGIEIPNTGYVYALRWNLASHLGADRRSVSIFRIEGNDGEDQVLLDDTMRVDDTQTIFAFADSPVFRVVIHENIRTTNELANQYNNDLSLDNTPCHVYQTAIDPDFQEQQKNKFPHSRIDWGKKYNPDHYIKQIIQEKNLPINLNQYVLMTAYPLRGQGFNFAGFAGGSNSYIDHTFFNTDSFHMFRNDAYVARERERLRREAHRRDFGEKGKKVALYRKKLPEDHLDHILQFLFKAKKSRSPMRVKKSRSPMKVKKSRSPIKVKKSRRSKSPKKVKKVKKSIKRK